MMTMADVQNEIAEQTINRCDELSWFLTNAHNVKGSGLHRHDAPRMMRELTRYLEVAARRYGATLQEKSA